MRTWLDISAPLKPATRLPAAEITATGRTVSLLGASAGLACLLGLPTIARADFIPPAGVTDYRLIFVSADPTAGTSSNIADYNSFAASEAALNPSLPSTVWTAVVSTDGASAANNIACAGCSNVPIFLVDGTEVATSSTALFNAATTSLVNGIDEDQNGNLLQGGYVWTGSFSDGTQAISAYGDSTLGNADYENSQAIEIGFIGATDGTAIDSGIPWSPDGGGEPIYAISGVISTVPEPMTAPLLAFGGIVTALAGKLRRRRRPAVSQ